MIQPGTRVFIPEFNGHNRPRWAIPEMDKYSGREYTVRRRYEGFSDTGETFWYMDEDNETFFWSDNWFIEIDEWSEPDMDSEPDILSFLGVSMT